ncbi:MAG: hypothetical protein ABL957_15620 [Parvularculaceae bacterium]
MGNLRDGRPRDSLSAFQPIAEPILPQPGGGATVVTSTLATGLIASVADQLSRTTS